MHASYIFILDWRLLRFLFCMAKWLKFYLNSRLSEKRNARQIFWKANILARSASREEKREKETSRGLVTRRRYSTCIHIKYLNARER